MEYIEFGKIVNTHALKGEIKIYPYTDNTSRILNLKKVYILGKEYSVQKSRFTNNMFVFKLLDIDTIEQAEALIGNMILREVKPEEVNDTEFFVKDLVGMTVSDEAGIKLGILEEVFPTGANDVYKVKMIDGSEKYLPAISSVVKTVDITNKRIIVRLMEGL